MYLRLEPAGELTRSRSIFYLGSIARKPVFALQGFRPGLT